MKASPESRRRARERGQRYQREIRDYFRATGWWVETAANVVQFIRGAPRSTRHDLFTLWDLCIVSVDGRRGFVQVTTPPNAAAHRRKILASGFPTTFEDRLVLALGRLRYRELRGPHFVTVEREWTVPSRGRRG